MALDTNIRPRKQMDDRCKHWLSKNDKVLYAILYNTLDDQLAAASLGETPEEDKKKAKGTHTTHVSCRIGKDMQDLPFYTCQSV